MNKYLISVVTPSDKFQEWAMTVDDRSLHMMISHFLSINAITKISVEKIN